MFEKDPEVTLPDVPTLLAWLDNPQKHVHVKAVALCLLLETIFAEKGERFAYNSELNARAQKEFNLPPAPPPHIENTPLSWLVYKAQAFVRHDHLVSLGYVPFTQELIDQAGQQHAHIEFPSGTVANVRFINGQWYAMKPRARKFAFSPDPFKPAKIVKG